LVYEPPTTAARWPSPRSTPPETPIASEEAVALGDRRRARALDPARATSSDFSFSIASVLPSRFSNWERFLCSTLTPSAETLALSSSDLRLVPSALVFSVSILRLPVTPSDP
jgi:hypothetical protein